MSPVVVDVVCIGDESREYVQGRDAKLSVELAVSDHGPVWIGVVRMGETPVRDMGVATDEGWVLLRDSLNPYLDGGEDRVFTIVRSASDLSSLSDELASAGKAWEETYHLDPSRANVVRALSLPADATVLELGAGCGAITRYLGETCAVVDAVEPVAARARVARARTRDLPSVNVFVGTLDDVPAVPAYDIVVVVGVLEYVGAGSLDDAPYLSFLQGVHAVLKPGGQLVLAIENKLGVKYLSGAPEDHSGIPFDSVEGYPGSSPARTFSRSELNDLMGRAGLTSKSKIAFPDYKMTRAVFDPDRFGEDAKSLLWRVPSFPSPDWAVKTSRVSDEERVWRSFVEAGLASEMGNSFVSIASKGAPVRDLWPDDLAGAYFSVSRRAAYCTMTHIRNSEAGTVLAKSLLRDGGALDGPRVTAIDELFVSGVDFYEVFVDTEDMRSVDLLLRWVRLIDKTTAEVGVAPIDAAPHNLVVVDGDELVAIDGEWSRPGTDRWSVLRRGALLTAQHVVAQRPARGHWVGCETLKDVATRIGTVVGLPADGSWLDRVVADEATFLATVVKAAGTVSFAERVDRHFELIRDSLDLRLVRASDMTRHVDEGVDGLRELTETRAALRGAEAAARFLQAEKDATERLLRHSAEQLHEAEAQTAEMLVAAQRRYEESQREHEGARNEWERLRTELEGKVRSTASLALRLSASEAATSALTNELAAVRHTVSWRVTAPLRAIRSALR